MVQVLANLRTGLDLRTGPPRCENTSADWTEPPAPQLLAATGTVHRKLLHAFMNNG